MSSDVSSERWICAAVVEMEDDKDDNRMSVERIVESMRDILVGEPSPRIIEQTLAKYCSKDIAWQIHDTTYRFHELIPYVLHSRNRSRWMEDNGQRTYINEQMLTVFQWLMPRLR